ncbi:hypothetical protein L211DRAFT_83970 [Terfezia boudieri ATCC MYA-4762]|uniref:Uncharacterized protein n=1 Tax=Terfezia boudieri ATCC MYA-4762 TaxID=1051890 RepID=A0A3N4LRN5_9PEZI|nr:hypothetical protein L211DRAFT_83970 [Terfezia boudieri ATCC MYA-4762]
MHIHTSNGAIVGVRPVRNGDFFVFEIQDGVAFPVPAVGFLQLHNVMWSAIGMGGLLDSVGKSDGPREGKDGTGGGGEKGRTAKRRKNGGSALDPAKRCSGSGKGKGPAAPIPASSTQ